MPSRQNVESTPADRRRWLHSIQNGATMIAPLPRSTRRIGGAVVVLLLALSLAACGGAPAAAPTATPIPTATFTPTPAPTATPTPAAEAAGADSEAGVAAAAADGAALVATELQINEMLQTALAEQQDLPISDVTVRLDPGRIVGSGKLALGFFNAAIQLSLGLSAVEGKVIPTDIEILLDGKPVPALLQGQIDAMTAPIIEEASRADYGFYVESVEITDDEIRIAGE
jgi:hypothetical protein